eukprot:6036092-Alexandrium_andersonii.AAC.2
MLLWRAGSSGKSNDAENITRTRCARAPPRPPSFLRRRARPEPRGGRLSQTPTLLHTSRGPGCQGQPSEQDRRDFASFLHEATSV